MTRLQEMESMLAKKERFSWAQDENPTKKKGALREVNLVYLVIRWVLRGVAWCYCRTRITGSEQIPKTGALLVAPNHLSLVDGPLLLAYFPRRLYFLTSERLWDRPWLGWICTQLGCVPVKRTNGNSNAVQMATQLLAQGKAVCIFPEGQINRKLGCLKPGVAILASMTGAPIVPVGLSGTHGVMPVEGRLRPYPVSLAAGSAIRVPRVRSNWVPEEEIQRTNHRLFQALRGLIRQAETLRVTPAEQILESGEKISCYGMAY